MIGMDFSNKVTIVTGSARGIGFEIARAFAQNGATVIVTDLSQENCDKAASELNVEFGVKTRGIATDVSKVEAVTAMIKTVMDEFGRIDVLVNNAGITRDNLTMRMSDDEWSSVINVNLNSVFYCSRAVMRPMLKQKYGRIVNIASVVGRMGNAGQPNYAAAKAGVIGLTKTIAKEISAKGITCNAIAPGFIETEMIKSLPKEYLDNIISVVPQKRLGKPADVAHLALFLASDLSAHITGQVVNVDGGLMM